MTRHDHQRKPSTRLRLLQSACPQTPDQLHRFVRVGLGLNVPRHAVTPNASPPFQYLLRSFFADQLAARHQHHAPADIVVWANRGGGKTLLGAVASLLDLIFKPGFQLRILGGSLEQSLRMHHHLLRLLNTPLLHHPKPGSTNSVLAQPPTQRRLTLANGSALEILAQSHRSVRGTRVHRLRCDEVEEFQHDIWQAAQLTTRSGRCGPWFVRGSVHALSTAHRPGGLMSALIDNTTPAATHRQQLRWSAIDTAQPCPTSRSCNTCPLEPDCQGRARNARGFIPIDDLIQQHARTSTATWHAEMLCHRPSRDDAVYPTFNPTRHVRPYTSSENHTLVAGMDFGLRSPTVFLWAAHAYNDLGQTTLHVIDEYHQTDLTLGQHIQRITARPHPMPRWAAVDPAGSARNAHTGRSDIDLLRDHGFNVRSHRHRIRDGIERVRNHIDHDRLHIDPRCTHLIHALTCYHFDHKRPTHLEPVKDGPDHAADALRYLIVNLDLGSRPATVINY
ncbi:phage terminase large subunit family protein [Mucisphaera calidilacus]|uniref:Terminase-like family protein n=1 Tax=Mucisphaera calidilacus TaxID=2527982 RepID=A0A518C0L4_9BACT|nr:hypothetical protein [Mucisphaera calidilacus]QDU72768.1 Terminase-like family protein [Mucisphaera calidilacus]